MVEVWCAIGTAIAVKKMEVKMTDKKRRVSGYGQSFVVRVPDDLLERFLNAAKSQGATGAQLVRGFMCAYADVCHGANKGEVQLKIIIIEPEGQ